MVETRAAKRRKVEEADVAEKEQGVNQASQTMNGVGETSGGGEIVPDGDCGAVTEGRHGTVNGVGENVSPGVEASADGACGETVLRLAMSKGIEWNRCRWG